MKITIVGAGYVGLSLAVLLSEKNEVSLLDISVDKVIKINNRISPIKDTDIENFLVNKKLNLIATNNAEIAYCNSDYIIIATPTDYDINKNIFDTTSIEKVMIDVNNFNKNSTVIIKSTVPIGYTQKLRAHFSKDNIIFSPEFLREGKALHDNLYPTRIVVGDNTQEAKLFSRLLLDISLTPNVPVIFTKPTEAESIKLFANSFLAMRVAFFNELDTFCEHNNLETKDIIEGISLDHRIGNHYNNPSFGYGGYCLPKDTKQLLSNYKTIPNSIIGAIVESNLLRKRHIAEMILSKNPKKVGIYRLVMKSGSDNFRSSAILDIIDELNKFDIDIIIYEPLLKETYFDNFKIIKDLDVFKNISDIIVSNRYSAELFDVFDKVYTRDIFLRE
jgi:UDPglucose 6-dehydrogenase